MPPRKPVALEGQTLSKLREALTSSALWHEIWVSMTTVMSRWWAMMRSEKLHLKFWFPVPLQFQTRIFIRRRLKWLAMGIWLGLHFTIDKVRRFWCCGLSGIRWVAQRIWSFTEERIMSLKHWTWLLTLVIVAISCLPVKGRRMRELTSDRMVVKTPWAFATFLVEVWVKG